MKHTFFSAVLAAIISFGAAPGFAQTLAFPGATGFGAGATGGRGGTTVHVTNLNDAGAGSLREAVSGGPRIVVFDVSGTITLKSTLIVHSDVTISGETSPGEGITIFGQEVSFSNAHNVIVRYMRIRQGLSGRRGQSTIGINSGSTMIFDHVSVAWGRWDTMDINLCKDLTFQNCLIGPGINPQRFGCLCQSDNITFSHNLWIDNQSRNPKAKGHIQYINNVVYNWGVVGLVGGHSAADHYLDVINNYFIKGPSSGDHFTGEYAPTDKVYQSGNVVDLDRDGKLNGKPAVAADFGTGAKAPTLITSPTMVPAIPVVADTAEAAYAKVLAGAGDSRHRDAIDTQLISQLKSLGTSGKTIQDPVEMGGPATPAAAK